MPLTTTATWPDLVAGRKAKASEVEAKFDWIEGTLYSHNAGNQTDNAYDIGTSINRFRAGYFGTQIEVGGKTLTANGIGEAVKAWGNIQTTGGTSTATFTSQVYNISSVAWSSAGVHRVYWETDFNTNTYAVVGTHQGITGTGGVRFDDFTTSSCRMLTYNNLGALADVQLPITLIAAGTQ